MDTVVKRLYEAMFLVNSADAAADWDTVQANIKRVLDRSDAEIVVMKKWDERRLAYDIQKKSRGTYILTYFNAEPEKISAMERDVQLSEQIMRVLIIRADHIKSEEDMGKETPLMAAEKAEAEAVAKAEERRQAIEDKQKELAAAKAEKELEAKAASDEQEAAEAEPAAEAESENKDEPETEEKDSAQE